METSLKELQNNFKNVPCIQEDHDFEELNKICIDKSCSKENFLKPFCDACLEKGSHRIDNNNKSETHQYIRMKRFISELTDQYKNIVSNEIIKEEQKNIKQNLLELKKNVKVLSSELDIFLRILEFEIEKQNSECENFGKNIEQKLQNLLQSTKQQQFLENLAKLEDHIHFNEEAKNQGKQFILNFCNSPEIHCKNSTYIDDISKKIQSTTQGIRKYRKVGIIPSEKTLNNNRYKERFSYSLTNRDQVKIQDDILLQEVDRTTAVLLPVNLNKEKKFSFQIKLDKISMCQQGIGIISSEQIKKENYLVTNSKAHQIYLELYGFIIETGEIKGKKLDKSLKVMKKISVGDVVRCQIDLNKKAIQYSTSKDNFKNVLTLTINDYDENTQYSPFVISSKGSKISLLKGKASLHNF